MKFKAFYDLAKISDRTVFLLRYQVSDYKAWEATEFAYGKFLGATTEKELDTNAYFFQETANLDFDIIDVTCNKGDVKTVIACISSPQDIVNPSTPPLDTRPETWLTKLLAFLGEVPAWAWVLIIVAVVAIVVGVLSIFFPVLRGVLKVIGKIILAVLKVIWLIISAPFRGIAALVKRGQERKRATAATSTKSSKKHKTKNKRKGQKR